jgi:capsular polysaccharide biosynthesis protein
VTARATIAARVASRWWLVVILTLFGAGAGYASSAQTEPTYQATTTLLIGRPLTDAQVNQDAIETSQRLATAYADLVGRQPILEGAATQLGLEVPWQELRGQVHASVPRQDSPIVVIWTEAASPAEATALAQAVNDQVIAASPTSTEDVRAAKVQAFVEDRLRRTQQLISEAQARTTRLKGQMGTATGRALDALRAQLAREETHLLDLQQNYTSLLGFVTSAGVTNYVEVLEQPEAGTEPVRPNVPYDVAAGALMGLMLGLIVAYLFGKPRRSSRENGRPETPSGSRGGTRNAQDADRSGLAVGQGSDRSS